MCDVVCCDVCICVLCVNVLNVEVSFCTQQDQQDQQDQHDQHDQHTHDPTPQKKEVRSLFFLPCLFVCVLWWCTVVGVLVGFVHDVVCVVHAWCDICMV